MTAADGVGLVWPGKTEALALADTLPAGRLMRDDAASLPGEARHRLIVGDNLTALKLLLPELAGGVKLIYIDPPYNTGQRFAYVDRASHAAWLSMLAPRLALARRLLRPDGALFVSIGHEEVHHLRLLLDETFGAEGFRNQIVIRRGTKNVQAQFSTIEALDHGHEYILFYARSAAARFPKLIVPRGGGEDGVAATRPGGWNNHWRGTERPTMRYPLFGITPERGQWRWSAARSHAAVAAYARLCADLGTTAPEQDAIDAWAAREAERTGARVDLLRVSARGRPEHYVPPAPGRLASDLWTDLAPNGSAQLRRMFAGAPFFETPKSCDLIRRIIAFASGPDDVVLDFFAGSCATMQAVLEHEAATGETRRGICVQAATALPRPVRLADGPALATIAAIGRERIRRAAAALGLAAPGVAVWRIVD